MSFEGAKKKCTERGRNKEGAMVQLCIQIRLLTFIAIIGLFLIYGFSHFRHNLLPCYNHV